MHNQDDIASDHGSDAGSEAMFSETEGQDDEEYRPQEASITLKAEYDSFADFKEYCAATCQTYIKRRSDKIQRPHAKKDLLQYIKLVYKCVHHSERRDATPRYVLTLNSAVESLCKKSCWSQT